ncbi:MAG: hypothetical protein JRE40_00040 [Deltaproteobacteria bacterium]|nr:hypothetical protein [Deltaproteobacteria bacterium]
MTDEKFVATRNIFFKDTGEYVDKNTVMELDKHSQEVLSRRGLIRPESEFIPPKPKPVKPKTIQKSGGND